MKMRFKQEIIIGHYDAAPINFHWTLLFFFAFACLANHGIVGGLIAFAAILILLLIHELGHATMARWLNLKVVTIRLYGFHGVCVYTAPDTESAEVAVSWGGIFAQIALFILALTAAKILVVTMGGIPQILDSAFFVWVPLNLLLILTNLLPISPLDGATAWKAIPIIFRNLRRRQRKVKVNFSKLDKDGIHNKEPSKIVSIELKRLSGSSEKRER